MTKDEVLAILKERRAELEAMKVTSAALFGSVVRGEAHADSDVDIMVEVERGVSLYDFVGIQLNLEEWIGRKVDLVTKPSLHPALREDILKEAVDAWS